MNMIASTTVIRGNGQCEVYMNGIVNQEIRRMNERYEAEMAFMKGSRNRLLADKVKVMRQVRRKDWRHRLKDRIETAWGILFGMMLGLGLIKEVEDVTE